MNKSEIEPKIGRITGNYFCICYIKVMQNLLHHFKQFIFPSFCASCKTFAINTGRILCSNCARLIRPVVSHQLAITSTKKMTIHAVGAYDQPLVSLILAKSSGNRTTASQLGTLLWQSSALSHLSFDYIVPVPLHWTRYAWRGYNQADEIARIISQRSGKPMVQLLRRTKRTPFQSYFKGEQREQNVKEVFQLHTIDRSQYKDKTILLVDDVMTSGATLKYAARTLLPLRPASIIAGVVARVA